MRSILRNQTLRFLSLPSTGASRLVIKINENHAAEHTRKLFHENDTAQKLSITKSELLWKFVFYGVVRRLRGESEAEEGGGFGASTKSEK